MKNRVFALLLGLLLYGMLELACWAGLVLMETYKNTYYRPLRLEFAPEERDTIRDILGAGSQHHFLQVDAMVGWSPKPNAKTALYQINSQGIRASVEYSAKPAEQIFRMSSFGDSFCFGVDVPNSGTWEEQLTRKIPGSEVLNFGGPGYGLDQAFLRYGAEGRKFNSHVVFICFMTENVNRHLNVFRPFYRGKRGYTLVPLAKPRFKLENGQLKLIPNPLPSREDYMHLLENEKVGLARLGEEDYFYKFSYEKSLFDFLPSVRFAKVMGFKWKISLQNQNIYDREDFNTRHEAFTVTQALFDEFYETVLRDGATPVIVLFPRWGDIERFRQGHGDIFTSFEDHFREKGYRFVNMLEAFKELRHGSLSKDFMVGDHYNEKSQALVAEHLKNYLTAQNIIKGR